MNPNDPYAGEKKLVKKTNRKVRKLVTGKKDKKVEYAGHTSEYWVKYVSDLAQKAIDYRSAYYDKSWMINWSYYLGLTNLKYNRVTGTLDWDYKDPLKFNINEIYAIVRAIRGAVTRSQPNWDVDAARGTVLTAEGANLLANFMSHLWKKLGMKKKSKEAVLYGLVSSLGVFHYGFDSDADNGEGELWVDVEDTFDILIDSNCGGNMQHGRFLIKVFKKDIEELSEDDKYFNTKDIQADNKVSPSEYKQQLEQKLNPQSVDASKGGTVLGYEAYCKYKDEQGNEMIRLITILPEQGKLIRFVDGDTDEMKDLDGAFPFVAYQPDINPNRVYSEGWVKHLVPLQRMLNENERSIAHWLSIFSKGKYVTTPNSGVKIVTNMHGEIITKQPGSTFEQQDIKPMPSTVFNQIDNIMRYMQDIGASNEAFMGRTPTGITSGVAIETLVANNMVNLADLVDNLEIALSELGRNLLKLASKKYSVTKEFKIRGANGKSEVFKVIGSEDPQGLAEMENVVQIPDDPQVDVVINSGVAYTKQGKQEIMQAMRQNGDVDRRTFLEEMGGFDVDRIEARLAEERAGMPVSENGMDPETMTPGVPGGQVDPSAQVSSSPLAGMTPQQLADFLQENGLTLDPTFDDDAALQALLSGLMDFEIVDNVIVPKAPLQQ